MRKVWLIAAASILLAASATVWASGIFVREIPCTVKIVEPPPPVNPDLRVYTNASCNVEVTLIEWGEVMKGNVSTRTVYVKNTGDIDYPSVTVTSNIPAEMGSLTGTPDGYALSSGAKQSVTVTLQIGLTATAGMGDFKAWFNGAY